jgi:hypothetical protein
MHATRQKNWHAIGWLVAILLIAAVNVAHAQVAPTMTFTAQNTVGAGSVVPVLTWSSTPAAQSCAAAGDPAWTGTKAASGTQTLAAITSSATYQLTCTWPGDTTATISWTPALTRTDGTPMPKCSSQTATGNCLRSFLVVRGSDATTVGSDSKAVDDRNATSYAWTGLPAGTHFFSVVQVDGDGVMSDQAAPPASKTITSTANVSRSVTITVNPKPSPATAVTAK